MAFACTAGLTVPRIMLSLPQRPCARRRQLRIYDGMTCIPSRTFNMMISGVVSAKRNGLSRVSTCTPYAARRTPYTFAGSSCIHDKGQTWVVGCGSTRSDAIGTCATC